MKFKACYLKLIEILLLNNRGWIYFFLFTIFNSQLFPQLPPASEIAEQMTIGWNIGNSLEVPSGETGWGNPRISQFLIDSVKKAGFNTIRIPCAWNSHANQTTLEIDPNFLYRVSEVVDYCYEHDMYVIINCHWDGGWLENNVTETKKEEVIKKQKAYWSQIAEYFKDYDEHLLFASANEPNVDNASQMAVLMAYHQAFIEAVRGTGGNNSSRVLVIQGPSTDIDKTNKLMTSMPVDSIESRLMAEIHYYTPWNFCGLEQDASWGKMFYFWGKDYHSATNTNRNANWGEETAVETYFKSMKTKFVDKGIPVILGEYGAIKRTFLTGDDLALHLDSREFYFKYITNAAIRYGMVPVYWDNGHNGNNGFALFNRINGAVVDQGALEAILAGSKVSTSVNDQPDTEINSVIESIIALPNPVSSSTQIQVKLKQSAKVNIFVYNILGRLVANFSNLNLGAGSHSVKWNIGDLSNGIYFINVIIGRQSLTSKILIIR